jgi:hypothetical protein
VVPVAHEVTLPVLDQLDRRQGHPAQHGAGDAQPAVAGALVERAEVGVEIVAATFAAADLVDGNRPDPSVAPRPERPEGREIVEAVGPAGQPRPGLAQATEPGSGIQVMLWLSTLCCQSFRTAVRPGMLQFCNSWLHLDLFCLDLLVSETCGLIQQHSCSLNLSIGTIVQGVTNGVTEWASNHILHPSALPNWKTV